MIVIDEEVLVRPEIPTRIVQRKVVVSQEIYTEITMLVTGKTVKVITKKNTRIERITPQ